MSQDNFAKKRKKAYLTKVSMQNFSTKKHLGQNFLINEETRELMVKTLQDQKAETIVEIGAGTGALTSKILELFPTKKIYAIEIDPDAIELLNEKYVDKKINIIFADILHWLKNAEIDEEFVVIGSLPYYITSPILHSIIKMKRLPETAILMVQKEVAQKICVKKGSATYLSTFIGTFFEANIIANIPKSHFAPEPGVESTIIRLGKRAEHTFFKENEKRINKYQAFLHKGFSHPRKMLNKVFSSEELQTIGVSTNKRPQDIDTENWVKLFNNLQITKKP